MGRNWEYSKEQGRIKRLQAELKTRNTGAPMPARPAFWSHDGTMQHYFNQGWNSVSHVDIDLFCHGSSISFTGDTLSRLRSLRQCHLR